MCFLRVPLRFYSVLEPLPAYFFFPLFRYILLCFRGIAMLSGLSFMLPAPQFAGTSCVLLYFISYALCVTVSVNYCCLCSSVESSWRSREYITMRWVCEHNEYLLCHVLSGGHILTANGFCDISLLCVYNWLTRLTRFCSTHVRYVILVYYWQCMGGIIRCVPFLAEKKKKWTLWIFVHVSIFSKFCWYHVNATVPTFSSACQPQAGLPRSTGYP